MPYKFLNKRGSSIRYMPYLTFLWLILLTILSCQSCQSGRVISSSHKRQPNWLFGIQRGYIIGYGTDKTIDVAQRNAVLDLRSKIAEAVFTEIQSGKHLSVRETMNRDKTYSILSEFVAETISNTGEGISARGVSVSKAADYYYQIYRERGNGSLSVLYAVKYPFTSFDLDQLIAEWEKKQRVLEAQILMIGKHIGRHSSLEELVDDIHYLRRIREQLADEYSSGVSRVLDGLQKTLHSLHVVATEEKLGEVGFTLISNGKRMSISKSPEVRADYLSIQGIIHKQGNWTVKYRESNHILKPGMRPSLNLTWSYRDWSFQYVHFPEPRVHFKLVSPVMLLAVRENFWGTAVIQFECLVRTEVSGLGGIHIEKIILEPYTKNKGSSPVISPITLDVSSGLAVASGSTIHRLLSDQRLSKQAWSSNSGSVISVKGIVFYVENLSGERKTQSFSGLEVKADW